MSVDIHKYGYASKGVSVVVFAGERIGDLPPPCVVATADRVCELLMQCDAVPYNNDMIHGKTRRCAAGRTCR